MNRVEHTTAVNPYTVLQKPRTMMKLPNSYKRSQSTNHIVTTLHDYNPTVVKSFCVCETSKVTECDMAEDIGGSIGIESQDDDPADVADAIENEEAAIEEEEALPPGQRR